MLNLLLYLMSWIQFLKVYIKWQLMLDPLYFYATLYKHEDLLLDLMATVRAGEIYNQPQSTACIVHILGLKWSFLSLSGPGQPFKTVQTSIQCHTYREYLPPYCFIHLEIRGKRKEYKKCYRFNCLTQNRQKSNAKKQKNKNKKLSDYVCLFL